MPPMFEMPAYEPSARAEVRPGEAVESAAKQILSTEAAAAAKQPGGSADKAQANAAGEKTALQDLKITGSDAKADAKTMEAVLLKYLHTNSGPELNNLEEVQKDVQALADKGQKYTADVFKQVASDNSGITHLLGQMSINVDTENGTLSAKQSYLDTTWFGFGDTSRSISAKISENKASVSGEYIEEIKPSDESGIPDSWGLKPNHAELLLQGDGNVYLTLKAN